MEPQAVFDELGPLPRILYDAFEAALQHNEDYFTSIVADVDSCLAPNLIRFHVKRYLQAQAPFVDNLEVEEIANNGLSLRFGKYYIRIWKTYDGGLPPAGDSRIKQAFLRQHIQLTFEFVHSQSLNLVILWQVDRQYRLNTMFLVCPTGNPTGSGPIESEWTLVITHPAEIGSTEQQHPTFDSDLPLEYESDDVEEAKEDDNSD